MPRKKQPLIGEGMNANLLKQFIDLSYKGNTSIAPEGYDIDAPLSDSRVKVYAKKGSNDKNIVVTHRGSVGLDDWLDNASYLFKGKVKGTKTYNLHRERHKKAVEKYGAKNIIAIGHSRAGLYLQELQKEFPIKENITYNKASGFFDIGRKNDENQTDIRVGNDIVSLLAPLQNRPNDIVKIDGTKNPFDFNTAHQASEIDKLGTTFVGKKDEMEGSGAMPKRRTLEQLQKLLKKYETRNTNLEKGIVYKTITIEQNDYDIYNTRRRIKNYEEKGEDLLETKKVGWNDTYKIKKPKKEAPKKEEPKKEEPKKEEPKKEEPKKIKLAPLQEIPEFKPKKGEPKKEELMYWEKELLERLEKQEKERIAKLNKKAEEKGKTKTAKPKKEAPKEEEKAFKANYFYDLPEDLQNEIRNKIVPDEEVEIFVDDVRLPHRGVMRSYKIGKLGNAYNVYKQGDKKFVRWVGVKTLVMKGAFASYIVNEFRNEPRPIPSNFRFYKVDKNNPITEWNEIQKQSTEPAKSYNDYFFPPKKKKGQPLYKTAKVGEGITPRISSEHRIRKLLEVEQRRLKRMRDGTTKYKSKYITESKTLEKISRLKKRLASAEANEGQATETFFIPKTEKWLKINKNDTYLNTPLKEDGKHRQMVSEIDRTIAELKAKKKKQPPKEKETIKIAITEKKAEEIKAVVKEEVKKVEEAVKVETKKVKFKDLTKEEQLARKKEYDRLRYLKIKAKALEAQATNTETPKQVEKLEENVEEFKEEVKELVADVKEEVKPPEKKKVGRPPKKKIVTYYKQPHEELEVIEVMFDNYNTEILDKLYLTIKNAAFIDPETKKVVGHLHEDGKIYSPLKMYDGQKVFNVIDDEEDDDELIILLPRPPFIVFKFEGNLKYSSQPRRHLNFLGIAKKGIGVDTDEEEYDYVEEISVPEETYEEAMAFYNEEQEIKKRKNQEKTGKGFNKKQLRQTISDKNKVIADLEETAYGGNYNTHSYLDNILDSNTTSQNRLILSIKINSVPKYIKSLSDL